MLSHIHTHIHTLIYILKQSSNRTNTTIYIQYLHPHTHTHILHTNAQLDPRRCAANTHIHRGASHYICSRKLEHGMKLRPKNKCSTAAPETHRRQQQQQQQQHNNKNIRNSNEPQSVEPLRSATTTTNKYG